MLKGSAFILILSLLGEGLGLIMIMIVGNYYSVAEAGLLLTLQNNLFLFGTIGSLGLGTGFLRFAPHYLESGRLDTVRGLQRWIYGVALAGLALTAVGHTAFLLWSEETRAMGTGLAAAASVAILFWGLVTLDRQLLRSLKQIFWSEFSYQVIRPVGGTLILAAALLWGGGTGAIVAALLLPLVGGFFYDLWRISRRIGGLAGPADYAPRREWQASAPHYAVINLSRVALQRLDLLVVAAMLGLEAAAIYGLAARLATLSTLAVEPIRSMFQPRASLHHKQGRTEELQRDVVQGTLWIAVVSLVVAVVFLTSAPFWLQLFGDVSGGRQSIVLLFILLFGYFVMANSSVASALLLMTGSERIQGRVNAVLIFLVYPPALWLGITWFGLYGAAVATALVRTVGAVVMIWLTWRRTGILAIAKPSWRNLVTAFGPLVSRLGRRGR